MPMDAKQKTEMYLEFLKEEGFRPKVDDDGDICFKMEGGIYFIIIDEIDEAYFRICYPNFWSIDDDDERSQVLSACDYATGRSKSAKVFTADGEVWGSIEMFLNAPEDFKPIFPRCMSALQNAVNTFVEKMNDAEAE